jgi:SET domain-containing protein
VQVSRGAPLGHTTPANIGTGYAIDGDTGDSLLVYINHSRSERESNVRFALLERPDGRVPIAICKRRIKPGEELLARYEFVLPEFSSQQTDVVLVAIRSGSLEA